MATKRRAMSARQRDIAVTKTRGKGIAKRMARKNARASKSP